MARKHLDYNIQNPTVPKIAQLKGHKYFQLYHLVIKNSPYKGTQPSKFTSQFFMDHNLLHKSAPTKKCIKKNKF